MKPEYYVLEARRIAENSGMLEVKVTKKGVQRFERKLGRLKVSIESGNISPFFEGMSLAITIGDEPEVSFLVWGARKPEWFSELLVNAELSESVIPSFYWWMKQNIEPRYSESFLEEYRPHSSAHEKLEWLLEYEERIKEAL